MKKSLSVFIITCLVFIDQIIKIIIDKCLKPIKHYTLINNVLSLTYVENRGASFGILQNQRYFLIILTIILICVGVYFILSDKIKNKCLSICLILIISGGIGNLIDRIFRTYVIDYIELLFINFAVFNFADILITFGEFLLIGWIIYDSIKENKNAKLKKEKENCE